MYRGLIRSRLIVHTRVVSVVCAAPLAEPPAAREVGSGTPSATRSGAVHVAARERVGLPYFGGPPAAPPVPRPPSDDEIRRRYGLPPGTRIVRSRGPVGDRVRLRPDEFHYRELESELHRGDWDRLVVVAGTTVSLTAQGLAVGEGSPARVTLRDARNRTVGRGGGPMHLDRAVVAVEVDRRAAERDPDGVLCAADVELTELKLRVVSAPLLVLPYAALDRAQWGAERAAEGDVVSLSCRLTGSAAGVERLGRERAEVAVLVRTDAGAAPLDEPVASFRVPVTDGQIKAEWAVTLGLDRWDLLSQTELDAEAARGGRPVGEPPYVYDRPHLVFRVRLAGLEAESGPLAVDDWVELRHHVGGEPATGATYTLTLADGSTRGGTLDGNGRAREDGLPPGGVAVDYDADDDDAGGDDAPPTPPAP